MQKKASTDQQTVSKARGKTNTSLRSERTETDKSFRKASDKVERQEDEKVRELRKAADVKLSRGRSDRDLVAADHSSTSSKLQKKHDARLLIEREKSDDATRAERALADTATARERLRLKDTMSSFLVEERSATDSDLSAERNCHDENHTNIRRSIFDERAAHSQTKASLSGRDEFLAIVSHDLRNPLNAILLGSDILHEALSSPHLDSAQALEIQAIIKRNAHVMERLILDLLDVERMSNGKIRVHRTDVSLMDLFQQCQDLFGGACAQKSISLELTIAPPGIDKFSVDHHRMLQVLSNLIGNAIRFTPADGVISLRAESFADGIRLSVRDTGCGIPVRDQKRIFEKFSQAKTESRQGLGLGLFIAKWIVEAHGGGISVI